MSPAQLCVALPGIAAAIMGLQNFESSKGVENLLCNGTTTPTFHPKYIYPDEKRPSLNQISTLTSVTTIDLDEFDGPSKIHALEKLRKALREDGFFEVVNHGIPEALLSEMMGVAQEFFEMPVEDRADLYSADPSRRTRVGTSFNVGKEDEMHWRDFLRHPCHPLAEFIDSWPSKPQSYRKTAAEYATAVGKVGLKLLEAISESLGLEKEYIAKALGKPNQLMQINYYPPCPNPDLTFGLGAHTDPICLTIIQHDDVPGLQILKENEWFDLPSTHGALFVNVSDQLQVISNGEYKSLIHRAITNSSQKRISIPTFYGPSHEAIICPAPSLVAANPDGPLYTSYKYKHFLDIFSSRSLTSSTLKHFEIPRS